MYRGNYVGYDEKPGVCCRWLFIKARNINFITCMFLCAFLFMTCDAVFQFIFVPQYLLSIIFKLQRGIYYSIQNEQIVMAKVEVSWIKFGAQGSGKIRLLLSLDPNTPIPRCHSMWTEWLGFSLKELLSGPMWNISGLSWRPFQICLSWF